MTDRTPEAEAAHREPHPAHNHESSRIPPPREVQDACPGCLAGRDVQRMQDVGISTDPTVEAVMNALASSGAEWHGDHPCYGCAITLRDRLRKYGYDAALAAQPAPVVAPDRDEQIAAIAAALGVADPKTEGGYSLVTADRLYDAGLRATPAATPANIVLLTDEPPLRSALEWARLALIQDVEPDAIIVHIEAALAAEYAPLRSTGTTEPEG